MSSESTTRSIPCEIQEAIIDQLHSDVRSLSSCSLVSKQWRSRARHWSFAEQEFEFNIGSQYSHSPSEMQRTQRFFELLHAPHSTIGFFFQRASIVGPDTVHVQEDVAGSQSDYDLLNTVLEDHLFLLPNLHTITVSYISWKYLQPEAKAIISSLRRIVSFSWISICVGRLTDLLSFCDTNFPNLETFKIRDVMLDEDATRDNYDIIPRLCFLDIRVCSELYSLLHISPSACNQPSNLDKLCFRSVKTLQEAALVGRFIEAAGPGLKHIGLDVVRLPLLQDDGPFHASNRFPISFARNANLKSLEILIISPFGKIWLQSIIATIKSQIFEYLTLWISLLTPPHLSHLDLESLEHSLVNRTDFPMLGLLRLKIIHTGGFQDSEHDWTRTEVERRLPILHQRGILYVTTRDEPPSEVLDGWHPISWD